MTGHAPQRGDDLERDSHDGCDVCYLQRAGMTIEDAPREYQLRGFAFYCREAGQMLSHADLAAFAANERELRS